MLRLLLRLLRLLRLLCLQCLLGFPARPVPLYCHAPWPAGQLCHVGVSPPLHKRCITHIHIYRAFILVLARSALLIMLIPTPAAGHRPQVQAG